MPYALTDLEEVGSAEVGAGVLAAIQTAGGATNLTVRRRFRVNANSYTNYLFQLLNPPGGAYIQDKKYNVAGGLTPAYLVDQHMEGLNTVDGVLVCDFAMVPSVYNEYTAQVVSFPGVSLSSLYSPEQFNFRSSPITLMTQVRKNHVFFLGNPQGFPTYPLFVVLTNQGYRTNAVTDQTTPPANEYIAKVVGRQEIVIDSSVIPWRGDIWECRTTFALAQ